MANPTSAAQLVDALEQHDDVLSWINDTLSPDDDDANASPADLTLLDQHISQLLSALDIASEDTASHLERVIDDVSRGIPRLAYDLHFMKDGATTLQNVLLGVLQRSKDAVPAETNAALDNLQTLDTIKNRMEAAWEVLREAEAWSTLESEVTALIGEKSYAKAAERLAEANKSMVVFQNTPEYDGRRTLMVNLQNQLEAALSTALVSAIKSQDSESCKSYFSIFSVIQRESEFRNYYYASKRVPIVSSWQNANLSDCGTAQSSTEQPVQTFSDFLSKFYAQFLSLLNTERLQISSIFPDPLITLSQFIITTFSSLQPSLSQRLVAFSTYHGGASLAHLIDALRATQELAAGINQVIEKVKELDNPVVSPRPQNTPKPGHARRRSSRMSISWRPGQSRAAASGAGSSPYAPEGMDWEQELFQPFLDFQHDYGSLERRFLDQSLRDIVEHDARDKAQITDRPRLFRERAIDIFGVADGSSGRCKAFTHGYGAVGLVQALDGFFESFVDMWTADTVMDQQSSAQVKGTVSDSELSDLDYTAQDWSHIQQSLHLLASGRAVSDRLSAFEAKLRSYLAQVAGQFRLSVSDPLNNQIATTKGENQLLEQSTLNSLELFTLFNSLEADVARDPPFSASLRPSQPQAAATPPPFLLPNAQKALSKFAQICQTSMSDTVLSPLRHHLVDYASSPIWRSTSKPNQSSSMGDLRVPTFSLSPTETVQRVADGLLNLPRLFEVYADDDALAFSLDTLPYVEGEVLQRLTEQSSESSPQPGHRRRQSVTAPSAIDPEVVSSAWLLSLGHLFMQYFTSEILPSISTLSSSGAAQLVSDLEYLSTTVRALNVEHAKLEKWKTCVGMDQETLNENTTQPLDPILEHVATIRGWR